jgi:hypothetical protein
MHIWGKITFWGAVLEIELPFRTSLLLGRHFTAWATPPPLFALVIFETGSHFLPRLAWTTSLLFMLPAITGMKVRNSSLSFFPLKRGLTNFFAWNHDPPDLTLLSNYDYRHEPPAPGLYIHSLTNILNAYTVVDLLGTEVSYTDRNHTCLWQHTAVILYGP